MFKFLCNYSPEDRFKVFECTYRLAFIESPRLLLLVQTTKQLRLASSQTIADRQGNAFIVEKIVKNRFALYCCGCRYLSIFDYGITKAVS